MKFELWWLLISNAGKILSRDEILKSLRGFNYDGQNRSIDIAISRIRKKLVTHTILPKSLKRFIERVIFFN